MPTYYHDLIQGTDEWFQARNGLLTASEMKLILTPTLKLYAANEKTRAHVYEIAAQRITGYTEPGYCGYDMERGIIDEPVARDLYCEHHTCAMPCGFITEDRFGFTLGYSPDATVGDDGLLEIKSRVQKHHLRTLATAEVPEEHILQCQSGLLISGRKWLDFVSYCAGLPMAVLRVYPDLVIQSAILKAAEQFESQVQATIAAYQQQLDRHPLWVPTERQPEKETPSWAA